MPNPMMDRLPFHAPLERYQEQARRWLAGFQSGEAQAVQFFHRQHPRFRDPEIRWLVRELPESEIRSAVFELADSQLAVARWYCFQSWTALMEYVEAVTQNESPVAHFESAVEAVIAGDIGALRSALVENPELVRARSTRITPFDPPVHRATLLHYVAANGVESYRQKTPANAVEIARTLLQAGAEAGALADMYGGQCTTMSMLVSSSHPAQAGVQVALVHTLLDFGASLEARGAGNWVSPLDTALAFGYPDVAEALVERGAAVRNMATAAGLGWVAAVAELLPAADAESRHRALALAAQLGHVEIVRLLLDAGEDPNRYNPKGNHPHSTPLHQAVAGGHADVVRLLVERAGRLDAKDRVHRGTPLGWAIHLRKTEIERYLRAQEGG